MARKGYFRGTNGEILARKDPEQRVKELGFIRDKPVCTLNNNIRLNLAGVNEELLGRLIASNFFNPNFMKIIQCIFNSIVVPYNIPDDPSYYARVKHWLRNILELLGAGKLGEAYKMSIKGDLGRHYVLKVQSDTDYDLVHELFVGLFGTNSLREQGNLNYVFGGFDCSHPIRAPKAAEPATWCNLGERLDYVIYERIEGPSLGSSLNSMSPNDFLQCLVQITLSLNDAYNKISYTHYDLHAENVILRMLPGPAQLAYKIDNTRVFINTRIIVSFIDYGLSYFRYANESYGSFIGFVEGVSTEVPFPMYDIFKILIDSFSRANREIKSFIRTCIGFFTTESVENILANSRAQSTIFWLPRVPAFTQLKHEDFYRFLLRNFGTQMTWLSNTPAKPLSCEYYECQSPEVIKTALLQENLIPTDPFEFYDYITYLNSINSS